jgi:protein TonB
MGVLEAFSTRPYAFAEEHMQYLIRLAELAENARLRESGIIEAAEEASSSLPPVQPRSATASIAETVFRAKALLLPRARAWFDSRTLRLALTGLTAGLLVLLGLFGWNSWHTTSTEASAKKATTQIETPDSSSPAPAVAQSDIVWKPSPVHIPPAPPRGNTGIETATKREVEQINALPQSPMNRPTGTLASPPSAEDASTIDPPKMGAIATSRSLPSLTASPIEMPAFGSPVSQGISGGILAHKVQPAYPLQALPLRLSGAVILQATIGEKGKVDDVKVVSGPPLLTAAAIDAVRQWRYTPFLLDGKPVKMQKQITINFQAP